MEKPDLLACPFCGNANCYAKDGHHPTTGDVTFFACDDCGAVVSFRPRAQGQVAFDAWNRRFELRPITIQ